MSGAGALSRFCFQRDRGKWNRKKTDTFEALSGENGTTYVSLFNTIITDQWNPVWQDYIAAVVGESSAPDMTAGLQSSISSDLYGNAAIAAFKDGGYRFDCDFINGVQSFTFNPDHTVTALMTDGSIATHPYEYLGQYNVGDGETMNYQGQDMKEMDRIWQDRFLRQKTMGLSVHIMAARQRAKKQSS